MAVIDTLDEGSISSNTAKMMAVDLIEVIDIFLIGAAIALIIVALTFYLIAKKRPN